MAAKLAGWHQAQPPKASPHANHPFGTLSAFFSTGWAVSQASYAHSFRILGMFFSLPGGP